MTVTTGTDDAKIKLAHLSTHFDKTFKKCEGGEYDKKLFVVMYTRLVEAVAEFYLLDVKSLIISVGFDEIYKKKFAELKHLEDSLKLRGMI